MSDEDLTRSLVHDATRGDSRAIDRLLDQFWPGLQAYLRRQMGPRLKAKESSSDLVQSVCKDVLLKLRDERFDYRGEAEFRQWLYNAARLKVFERFDYYTAGKRDMAREQPAQATDESQRGDERLERMLRSLTTPSAHADRNEELLQLERAFARLTDQQQEIIRLIRLDGLDHEKVGRRLGISAANSRTRFSRALARLTALVRGRPGDPGEPDQPEKDDVS